MDKTSLEFIRRHSRENHKKDREAFLELAQTYDEWIRGELELDDKEVKLQAVVFAGRFPGLADYIHDYYRTSGDVSKQHLNAVVEAAQLIRASQVGFFVS
ncbi:hypothetical protein [Parvularcula sp. IMCC14364]|uniref:hypothetical protein n=1 Tax=Parvularcula sp. IMCC14364 TaxID=3067902 RepID=UPI002740C896|nr:hypothetical protein [Parvularcula sp. IMCC14364]